MISHQLLEKDGLLIVTPQGKLEREDFQNLAREVDPYLEREGRLRGLMIYTKSFPGWDDFAAFVAHLKFIKNHHQQIERVAAVTDSDFMSIAQVMAKHFVHAEIQQFPYQEKDRAMAWLLSDEPRT